MPIGGYSIVLKCPMSMCLYLSHHSIQVGLLNLESDRNSGNQPYNISGLARTLRQSLDLLYSYFFRAFI